MIRADVFVEELRRIGIGIFTGVPCSYLKPLINQVIDTRDLDYIGATNEGDAVAIACGADLGGQPAVVMFQNSGFGNAVSPLTSLTSNFRIPALLIATWRGEPTGAPDEPQHELMGKITPELFDLLGIPWAEVPAEESELVAVLGEARKHMQLTKTPYALLLKKGMVAPHSLETQPRLDRDFQLTQVPTAPVVQERLEPDEVLREIQSSTSEHDALIATTGFTGRALYAQADRPNQFYMVGSMGCASSLALGLAKAQPKRRVVVIDGDGAMLMRMGSLATIGREQPPGLVHILLDNAAHDSTGTQGTVSPWVDLASVARACGYPTVLRAERLADLRAILESAVRGPALVHVKTKPRSDRKLPRPEIKPHEVAERFRRHLAA